MVLLHENILKPDFSDEFIQKIKQCDAIIIGGGDLLIPQAAVLSFWHQEYLKKPVYIYGVGVPQWLPSTEAALAHYKFFLEQENVRLITVRDEESAKWIRNTLQIKKEIFYAPDITCARTDIYRKYKKNIKVENNVFQRIARKLSRSIGLPGVSTFPKTLGLITRDFPDLNYENLYAMCELVHKRGYFIRQIVLGTGEIQKNDLKEAMNLEFPNRDIVIRNDVGSLLKELSECSVVVSMKFHGCLAAMMLGRKTMALLRHDKFYNLLNLQNKPDYISTVSDDTLIDKVDKLLDDNWDIDVTKMYEQARKGLRQLKNNMTRDLC